MNKYRPISAKLAELIALQNRERELRSVRTRRQRAQPSQLPQQDSAEERQRRYRELAEDHARIARDVAADREGHARRAGEKKLQSQQIAQNAQHAKEQTASALVRQNHGLQQESRRIGAALRERQTVLIQRNRGVIEASQLFHCALPDEERYPYDARKRRAIVAKRMEAENQLFRRVPEKPTYQDFRRRLQSTQAIGAQMLDASRSQDAALFASGLNDEV